MHPVPVPRGHGETVCSAVVSCREPLLVPSQRPVPGGTGYVYAPVGCVEMSVCSSQVGEAFHPFSKVEWIVPLSSILRWPMEEVTCVVSPTELRCRWE